MKCCSRCKQLKTFLEFGKDRRANDGLNSACLECARAAGRAATAEYRKRNPEANNEVQRRWRAAHPEKVRAIENRRQRLKRQHDPAFKLIQVLRTRITRALRGASKSAGTAELVGCSFDQLCGYLEIQFQDGMTWQNYGKWHVDHKKPCASFDFSDPRQQKICFHYSNLQPLWALDNLRKGDSV